jgi:hypothetical protein
MEAEREILQRKVFPIFGRSCRAKGFEFQPIDLRWGVSQEAGQSNKTMRICLRELARCQDTKVHPNLLVLLGDRYGWCPLPERIPAEVFDHIKQRMVETRDQMLARLEEFYLLDQNAIPWEYVIRPRNGMNQVEWTESVERPLLASMERITDEMGLSSMKKWELGIGNSATHQEIIMGVMKAASREHIHAFRRIVRNPHDIAIPESFQDVPDPKVFNYRDELNAGLIEVLGEPGRAGSNFHQYTLEWEDYGVFKETGLDQFAKGVLEALETALEATVS